MFRIRFISACWIQIRFMKRIRLARNQPKSWKISAKINQNFTFYLFKNINFCLPDINIYLIKKHKKSFLEKYIFNWKKVVIFSILDRIRIRYSTKWIRIHIKMKKIRNTDFNSFLSRLSMCLLRNILSCFQFKPCW